MSESATVREYTVVGMSCDHCVRSVHQEVADLAGVESVDVDLSTGRMVVAGDTSEQDVRDAVAEAGYEVAA